MMKIGRYWVREEAAIVDPHGRQHTAAAWGWSPTNIDEARQRAKATAERVARWLIDVDAKAPPTSQQYQYLLDRPPREEIIQEFRDDEGETAAFISRNRYGSLVLNSRDLMFVDIDFPKPSFWNQLLASFLGNESSSKKYEAAAIERVRALCDAHPDVGVRLYLTAAGLRLIVTDRPLEADGHEARRMLEDLNSDPLYRRLCENQQCFRARLSPKIWRIGVKSPPWQFPFANEAEAADYRNWLARYDAAASEFATCRLIETFGPRGINENLAPLLDLHDSLTRSNRDLPLA
jgi:hypothetical protein